MVQHNRLFYFLLVALFGISCGSGQKGSDNPQAPSEESIEDREIPSSDLRNDKSVEERSSGAAHSASEVETRTIASSPALELNPGKAENYIPNAGFQLVAETSLIDGCQKTVERKLGEPVQHLNRAPIPNFVHLKFDEKKPGNLQITSLVADQQVRLDTITAEPATITKIADSIKAGKMLALTVDKQCQKNDQLLVKSVELLPSPAFPEYGQDSLLLASRQDRKDSLVVAAAYRGEKMLSIKYNGSISESDMSRFPEQIKMNLFNRKTLAFVGDWQSVSKDVLLNGNIVIKDELQLFRTLPNLANISLVFDVERAEARSQFPRRLIFDLGTYCTEKPSDYFKNLSDPTKKCSEIRSTDIEKGIANISFNLK